MSKNNETFELAAEWEETEKAYRAIIPGIHNGQIVNKRVYFPKCQCKMNTATKTLSIPMRIWKKREPEIFEVGIVDDTILNFKKEINPFIQIVN